MHDPVFGRPCCHLAIALAGYRKRGGGKPRAQSVDRDRYVDVLVGVDADDDGFGCDIMHIGPPGWWNPKMSCERTGLCRDGTPSGSYQVTSRSPSGDRKSTRLNSSH